MNYKVKFFPTSVFHCPEVLFSTGFKVSMYYLSNEFFLLKYVLLKNICLWILLHPDPNPYILSDSDSDPSKRSDPFEFGFGFGSPTMLKRVPDGVDKLLIPIHNIG